MAAPISLPALFAGLLRSKLFSNIPKTTYDFSGQTVIVTGSNRGLGLEAARLLVQQRAAKVILAVRTISKGESAAADILATTKATQNTIEVWELDMSNYDSIKAFAKRAAGLERLDAVIQNAGISIMNFGVIDGEEQHIRVNTIGAILLGLLLLPKLKETSSRFSTQTRLSLIGSEMMWTASCKQPRDGESILDKFVDEKEHSGPGDGYSLSKLFLYTAVREIAARSTLSPESNVLINVVSPGPCRTDLVQHRNKIEEFIQTLLFKVVGRSAEDGGRQLVDGVKPEQEAERHGAFLLCCVIANNGANVNTEQGQRITKRANEELFARLEKIEPGVTNI